MRVNGSDYRTLWRSEDGHSLEIIDQTRLPHEFSVVRLNTLDDVLRAIVTMQVRGAPLIGVTAAYGLALALASDPSDAGLESAARQLITTRPTAINLAFAVRDVAQTVGPLVAHQRAEAAYRRAQALGDDEVDVARRIGEHGAKIIEHLWHDPSRAKRPLAIATHCNAGWLATLDWGTALAPIYTAHRRGIPLQVWVAETRPRLQGARLTAWELSEEGIAHTIVVDSAAGHLMQRGLIDLCLVGTDRTTANGDVCNKIGTYMKALAAHDNHVPFYAAVPHSSIDWTMADGTAIPIEARAADEVHLVAGLSDRAGLATVRITNPKSLARNDAFDVTPARLLSGLITERGVCAASAAGLLGLYPERHG